MEMTLETGPKPRWDSVEEIFSHRQFFHHSKSNSMNEHGLPYMITKRCTAMSWKRLLCARKHARISALCSDDSGLLQRYNNRSAYWSPSVNGADIWNKAVVRWWSNNGGGSCLLHHSQGVVGIPFRRWRPVVLLWYWTMRLDCLLRR